MKRKAYEVPAMDVVEVRQQAQLLAGSLTGNRDNPYGDPEDPWSGESPAPLFNDDLLNDLLFE